MTTLNNIEKFPARCNFFMVFGIYRSVKKKAFDFANESGLKMTDEKKLLLRLKRGERGAIEDAVEVYTPYLSTVLYNMCGRRLVKEDAEEVISDTFVALWKNAERVDEEKGTLRSYIAATARNFALKKLSKTKNFADIAEIEVAAEGDFASDAAQNDELWNAVMSLGEPDNEIFVRYYKFGEKLNDIATATGVNLSTVKTKLSRGKTKLKKILSNAEERYEN